MLWGANISCKFSFYFKPFGSPLQAHVAVLLFILCGESETTTSVTVYLECMFFISALTFLAKCDLVCVKLKKKCWINWCQMFCTISISPFSWTLYWRQGLVGVTSGIVEEITWHLLDLLRIILCGTIVLNCRFERLVDLRKVLRRDAW